MTDRINELGQAIGPALGGWTARPFPAPTPMAGRYCTIEKLDADTHGRGLFAGYAQAGDARYWTYLFSGPFACEGDYLAWVRQEQEKRDPQHYAILDGPGGKAAGTAALMRIEPAHGAIEIGHIHYAPVLQHTRAGTEAMYLFMRRVFDELGYRRYEWKCDALNAPSRRAAERLGFRFEGIFRQAVVYKDRSRDTAWYAIIDKDWPALRNAFEAWLDPTNFDVRGRQKSPLRTPRANSA